MLFPFNVIKDRECDPVLPSASVLSTALVYIPLLVLVTPRLRLG
jgi:hypothetical protein